MFYPKLPRRASFPAILEALYADRVTGFALLQLRNGEPVRVYKVDQAVEVDTPAATRHAELPTYADPNAPEVPTP